MTKRLLPFIALFFILAGTLVLLNFLGLQALAAVRAYVNGESQYSKAQKEAVYNLSLYISTRNELYFQKFQRNIEIPLGGQRARNELQKSNPNIKVVRLTLTEGGTHPDDVRNMIMLFKYGKNTSLMRKPIALWSEGDIYINKLHSLAFNIHNAIINKQLSNEQVKTAERAIYLINEKLTVLEDQFAVELNKAGRSLKSQIIFTTIVISFLLSVICIGLTAIFINQLKESGEKYSQLFRESLDMVFITSVGGEIIDINQAGLELLEVNSKEEINLNRSILPFYGDSENRMRIRAEVDKSGFVKDYPLTMVSAKGKILNLLISGTAIKNRQDEIIGYRGIGRDVTHKLFSEEQLIRKNVELEKINTELDRLVYTTSHDLRSPLSSVLGLINLAKNEPLEKERSNYFGLMEKTIKKLDKLVIDIMNYSRNSRLELLVEEVWFDRLTEESIESFKFIKNVSKIKFSRVIQQEVPFYSDKNRITTILNNLIYNAIKFHEYRKKEPFIYIEVTVKNSLAVIRVKDNGKGIEEKHQTKVFDMFYKGTQVASGSGLGLYIVKEMTTKLKGKISMYSFHGTGTEFVIQLPELSEESTKG
ncbi:PAS domain-containing sensor histidine kinase [Solitalea sp. MAHUQ-68]|uniref:histidine kinase n=1 Tax=Solitalea agri TaxID=2953739 RepID=A0A9X2F9N3_9SPHI|nr:PAS domain-containing sensor histidine kinase [Solitalea agri]MCO4292993.1 PAS domain-containing sensor histidine kinase [Solitalea agri]